MLMSAFVMGVKCLVKCTQLVSLCCSKYKAAGTMSIEFDSMLLVAFSAYYVSFWFLPSNFYIHSANHDASPYGHISVWHCILLCVCIAMLLTECFKNLPEQAILSSQVVVCCFTIKCAYSHIESTYYHYISLYAIVKYCTVLMCNDNSKGLSALETPRCYLQWNGAHIVLYHIAGSCWEVNI